MPRVWVHSIIAFLVLLALIFLSVSGVLAVVLDGGRKTVEFLQIPFVSILLRIKIFFSIIFSVRDLSRQNDILSRQVQELTSQVAVLEKAGQENRILRDALGFETEGKSNLVPAEVIGLDPFNLERQITLNRGRRQGVEEGDPVVVSGNILVGAVTAVFGETSQMQVITSASMVVNAESPNGKATGVVRGEHGVGLLFDLISQSDVIKTGDKVITSGLGGLFPKNLLIGKIGEVRTSSSELFQKANIIPAVDIRSLKVVFVLKK